MINMETFQGLVSLLHPNVDPQYAQLYLEEQAVEYCFKTPRGVCSSDRDRQGLLNLGFAHAVKSITPNSYVITCGSEVLFRVGNSSLEKKAEEIVKNPDRGLNDPENIHVFYQAKSLTEFKKICRFFEKIPLDSGDLPKKGQTFFGYD